MSNAEEPVFEVVWPLGRLTTEPLEGRHRLPDPTGKTLAFVWDYVFRGDQMWEVVKQSLAMHYPDMRFVGYEQFGNTHGHDEREVLSALPARLQAEGVDAVLAGVGA